MNSCIQRPTKIISMYIGGEGQSKETKCTRKREIMPVDFYIMNSVPEDSASLTREKMSTTAMSELLDLARIRASNERAIPKRILSKDCIDFIILSLKNDVRVKHFRSIDSTIKICLWTVEDAIALYRQYFKLVEMSFVEDFDLGWTGLWSLGTTSRPQQTEATLLGDVCRESKSSVLKIKPFSSSSRSCAQHFTGLYKSQKDEFDGRVEYFSRMKPLFTKGDFKKMEAALESGCFDFVFKNCKELAVGSVSNVIVQKAIRHMSDDQICLLIKSFGYDIAPISATKYGAYTVQTLISAAVGKASQNLISCYFEGWGRFLIPHEIGNYSIQKILRFDMEIIYDFFMRDLERIIDSHLGLKVFKRCIPFFMSKKNMLLERLATIETPENSEKCKVIMEALNE